LRENYDTCAPVFNRTINDNKTITTRRGHDSRTRGERQISNCHSAKGYRGLWYELAAEQEKKAFPVSRERPFETIAPHRNLKAKAGWQ
jgi:hypothetical protein